MEFLEHELGQLESGIFVVDGGLREDDGGVSRGNHELVNETLSQDVLKIVEVDCKTI